MRKSFSVTFFLILPGLLPFCLQAEEAATTFERANQAYINGEYAYAAELYEEMLSGGLEAAALYFNLGNAYFKENRLAHAILNYERARLLKPFDDNIMYNLELARSRTTDRIETVPLIFYERWWQRFILYQSVDGWAKTGLIMLVLALLAALGYFFTAAVVMKKTGFFLALLLLFFAGISFIAAQRQYVQFYLQTDAIVFSPRVTAKSSPNPASPDLFVIHEGTKVRITNELGEWSEIRLENGNVGWLKNDHIIAVRASGAAIP